MNVRTLQLVSLFIYLSTTAVFAQSDNRQKTYGDLAAVLIPPGIDALTEELAILTPSILPHETKDLRKSVGRLRALLDLFSFAYPRYDVSDPWAKARSLLGAGYDVLGNFKDVFDRQGKAAEDMTPEDYREDEVKRLRFQVLIWKERYLHFYSQEKVRTYFQNPLRHSTEYRPLKRRPKYYWRLINFAPRVDQNAREVFLKMSTAILCNAILKFPLLWDINHLRKEEERKQLHDFRKQMRNIVKLPTYIPELGILDEEQMKEPSFKTLQDLVRRFGSLNDKVMSLAQVQTASEAETPEEQAARLNRLEILEHEISQGWESLKHWLWENKIPQNIQKMIQALEGDGGAS
ncbi:MAG: hypothetical protein HYW48_00220 [Deltaproteobacteria bacterium]|nr:hypothetical protein [Deltaproteobacteria bacterium]